MSSLPSSRGPSDRPLLRVFSPEVDEALTLAVAHSRFRLPILAKRSRSYQRDCLRALAKWVEFESTLGPTAQRIDYPLPTNDQPSDQPDKPGLPLSAITSSLVRQFQDWLLNTTTWGPSQVNKAVREVLTTIALAGDEGLEVRPARCRRIAEPTGAKIYLDELQIACLWSAAEGMSWPAAKVKPRAGSNYTGTGLPPSTFWRSIIVLLRSYGMRVQDLVAYEADKIPITWGDVTFDPRTPNPNGREEWPLGWLYYQSGKVGRKYYLPLTRHTRAAIDRLHAAASARAAELGLDAVPSSWPVIPCPHGGALPREWKTLCKVARVAKPIKKLGVAPIGDQWIARTNVGERRFATESAALAWLESSDSYVLEDFRSTAATFYATIEKTLPNKVCGWADGEKANVGRTNYINDEPFLLKYLPGSYQAGERYFATKEAADEWARGRPVEFHPPAPMPRCFDDWL